MSGTIFGLGLSQQIDLNGQPLVGCKLYLYVANTSTPVVSYKDSALTIGQENAWPIVADANGRLEAFWLADGSYRARLTDASNVVQFDELSVPVIGPSTVTPPSPTDLEAVFVTGMPLWLPVTGVKTGWVRMNARTIGSATSGASEFANANAEDLFLYIWANFTDAQCPVATGRGGSAAADWAANKKIATIDMRGRGPFGLADMGNADNGAFTNTSFTGGNGITAGAAGGIGTVTLARANLPNVDFMADGAGNIPVISDSGGGAETSKKIFDENGTLAGAGGAITAVTGGVVPKVSGHIYLNGNAAQTFVQSMPPFLLGTWYWKL